MKMKKEVISDGVPIEMWKMLGDVNIGCLKDLFN